jgi:alcohol dehydrogenase
VLTEVSVPFRIPTQIHIENGCAHDVGPVCRERGLSRVLLVHDPGITDTPTLRSVSSSLKDAGVAADPASEFEANPRVSSVEALGQRARSQHCDAVVGVGGGSALDAAKAAAMLATNPGDALDFVGRNRYANVPIPFIAIPTTCGTGSEVTWVSVVTEPQRGVKLSLKGETMFPDVALVDPEALCTLPADIVAWTGLDALTHALEAYTGRLANPLSDVLAERAIALIFRHLRAGHADISGARHAREGLMRASTMAGLAFGNSDVAAVHCLSETLGGRWDVPHGMANAILLAPVLRSHLPVIESRLSVLADNTGLSELSGATTSARAEAVLAAIERLVADVRVPGFASLGIGPEHYDWIGEQAACNGSNPANPREMNAADYVRILMSLGTPNEVPGV